MRSYNVGMLIVGYVVLWWALHIIFSLRKDYENYLKMKCGFFPLEVIEELFFQLKLKFEKLILVLTIGIIFVVSGIFL